jgi:serine O-acetyltransferase
MIHSKEDYKQCLEADRIALKRKKPNSLSDKLNTSIFDDIWTFEKLLRKNEFLINCRENKNIFYFFNRYRFLKLRQKLAIEISPNCFDDGLCIAHAGGIIVHHAVKVGKNCTLQSGVVIGQKRPGEIEAVPIIGNNVTIGAGAKILGRVTIADNITIGANAVVTKSFTEPGITIVGIPARKLVVIKD